MNESKNSFNEFLAESGLNKYFHGEVDLNTCLFHDLNIYGDIAESYIELLNEKYGVDISKFEFERYFPLEFSGDTAFQRFLYSFVPFLKPQNTKKEAYTRLSFGSIKAAIEKGQLC